VKLFQGALMLAKNVDHNYRGCIYIKVESRDCISPCFLCRFVLQNYKCLVVETREDFMTTASLVGLYDS